jgi:homoserine kinase
MNKFTNAKALTDLPRNKQTVEVCVPASTSNLGAGFDCYGLALRLYLTVQAEAVPSADEQCRVQIVGEGASELPVDAGNLIFRAMRFAAERERLSLPPVRLEVRNEIPLGRGLGSSAAAIVAGVALCGRFGGRELSHETVLRHATELEGHPDNIAASVYGGWTTACISDDGGALAVKRHWPAELKIVVVSPDIPLETKKARASLPNAIERADAVYNLQRAALFSAAIENRAYELLWEATRDRLHQVYRAPLVPGLADALSTPRLPGLVGLALSGAGPSVVALALDNFEEIGETIAANFRSRSIETTVRLLDVDEDGLSVRENALPNV